jgi:hypothetical protein
VTVAVCPRPRVGSGAAIEGPTSGDLPVRDADRVPSTETVPTAVADLADGTVRKRGNGRYRIGRHTR